MSTVTERPEIPLRASTDTHPGGLQQTPHLADNPPTPPPKDVASTPPIQPSLRSCITCRRRKVRCNKIHPCSNCTKANTECVFPGPGRAPRKPRNRTDSELLTRLRRVEGVLKSLGAEVNDDSQLNLHPDLPSQRDETKTSKPFTHHVDTDFVKHPDPRDLAQREVEQEFGKLVIGDGRSRYLSNRFWSSLGDEVEELRDILGATSDEEENYSSPESHGLQSTYSRNHDGFLFGFCSLDQTLRDIHPRPDQRLLLWDVYLENVAPLVPIFHKPTLRKFYFLAHDSLDSLNKNAEAAMFAVYYAAITSMDSSQCVSILGEERHIMLSRSRLAMEQAMARANLLNCQSVVLLQATLLFLLCVRRQDDSRYVLSMVAIVVRLAQGLGVHRDGSTFGLQPFETEMRRRLWWHICLLDYQVAEDHGCDPFIYEPFYDTRIPLNINDDDICQESTEPPEERVECTELTFHLIRCEIIASARRLSFIPPSLDCSRSRTDMSLEDRQKQILELSKRMEERYVQHCTMTTPILWVCATVVRLALTRLWLTIHEPLSGIENRRFGFADEKHNRLFLASIDVVEFSCLLQTNENTKKWSWLFRTHTQWSSVAFLLSELCVRPISPAVDRAWHAINSVYEIWNLQERKGVIWRAINKLMKRATQIRETKLQQLQTQFQDRDGGAYDGKPLGSIDDHLQPRSERSSEHISPALQVQGKINNNVYGLSSGINTDLDKVAYSPFDIQTSVTPMQQNAQLPLMSVPFWEPGDVFSHYSAAAGMSPFLQQPPQRQEPILGSDAHSLMYEPSWDDWDQVVREFRMDMAEGTGMGTIRARDWLE
ncbi:fungal specific transcription factor domain-containing protein [Histoplasma capsulatum G186AR]|uniref:C6 finger domain transcription factor nscR n=2 Tax=Ajellomyces capsulatus TaxID=5037 RepID=C0NBN3_AJECG|nr:fungal specific transcription factor domain-containing protein [Histoplasma capsulatum G186AR]EEH11074.1 fungal specific transcription factor domain-containing protein [Histoplasma capsulatum G186AR]KAG5303076.1 fungal specific transcription factor domain-containing protein [Histoplasma capsulatum]QSS71522.1 fungal specific transcription factor domain-containing protein [Histoplasma capsulatum G186AR]